MGGVANESLKSLKAAALNAQDAAFRYKFQTLGFREARKSSNSNTSDELTPELCHTSVADAGKGTEVQTEKEIIVRGKLSQARRSCSTLLQAKSTNMASK